MNLPALPVDVPPRRRSGRPDKPIPRTDLLRVARDLFAARGYAGVSMADIAHKAGLQGGSRDSTRQWWQRPTASVPTAHAPV